MSTQTGIQKPDFENTKFCLVKLPRCPKCNSPETDLQRTEPRTVPKVQHRKCAVCGFNFKTIYV